MAPTFPCPRSHSALVHSSRQTDGGPSSCTSSPSARTSLETPTLSYVPSLSFLPPSIYLSVFFPFSLSSRQKRALGLVPSISPSFLVFPLCFSLFLLVCARSCYPPLFLLLRSPRRPAPSERTETTPSLSTKHRYITQQRHHTRPRKNEPRADY